MKFPSARGRWLAFAGLFLVLALAVGWSRRWGPLEQRLARYRAAGQPTTLAELDAWYAPVPDSDNAATALLEAASAWRPTSGTNVPGTIKGPNYPKHGEAWPVDLLAAARAELVSNALPLAQMHAALERPRNRYPINLKAGANLSFKYLPQIKEVGGKLGLEARYAAESGNLERATDALLATLVVARTLEEEPSAISYLVRLAIIGTSLEATQNVLSRTALTEEQLRRLQAAFIKAEATNHLSRAIMGERCLSLDILNWPTTKLVDLFSGLPDETPPMVAATLAHLYDDSGLERQDLEFYLEGMDQLAEAATRSRSEMPARQLAFQTHLNRLDSWRGRLRPLSRLELPNFADVLTVELRWVATLRCAQTAMAIERWRLAHAGALPEWLGELVPQYLAAVPEDPLVGKPLKYHTHKTGYVVYSVGEDGIDQGGVTHGRGSGLSHGGDYTFTVNR